LLRFRCAFVVVFVWLIRSVLVHVLFVVPFLVCSLLNVDILHVYILYRLHTLFVRLVTLFSFTFLRLFVPCVVHLFVVTFVRSLRSRLFWNVRLFVVR
jgi:hypothetical protein